ncbi:MAG: FRG domain-containing protein [Carnobacterium sp.]|uniref:FRG domain-containing protein n=1 Tax=Carnobacterium sp. TaxID=48221 RepID=UPI0033158A65
MATIIFEILQEISKKIEELEKKFSKYQCNQITAFRGESRDWKETALTPSLFRTDLSSVQENELFELLQDFDIAKGKDLSNLEKAIEAQHYIAYSRLLDITFNVLPALYFACENDFEYEAKLYILSFPDHYSPNSKYLREYFDAVLNEENSVFYKNFKVISHSFSNERIRSQSGGFILFPSREYYTIPETYYKTVTIPGNKKKQILNDLEKFFNISNATIYPEKDKRREYITSRIKKNTSFSKKNDVPSEVGSFIQRVRLEAQITIAECDLLTKDKTRQIIDNKLRELRKNEEDLIVFIKNSNLSDKDSDELITNCRKKYSLIKYNLLGVI